MSLMTLAPMTLQTTGGFGVRPISEGKEVKMNDKAKQTNDVVMDSGFRSYLPDWEWLDDVGETAGNVASTVFTAWAQTKAGISGTESNLTSQGDPDSSTMTGAPQKEPVSFIEKNKTALMIGGAVLGIGVLFLAIKK
jgi:hypothetical protein